MQISRTDFNSNLKNVENAEIDDQEVTLDNGVVFNVKASNPHGFYAIHLKKGHLPDELTGKYTGADLAIQHAKSVLERPTTKAA